MGTQSWGTSSRNKTADFGLNRALTAGRSPHAGNIIGSGHFKEVCVEKLKKRFHNSQLFCSAVNLISPRPKVGCQCFDNVSSIWHFFCFVGRAFSLFSTAKRKLSRWGFALGIPPTRDFRIADTNMYVSKNVKLSRLTDPTQAQSEPVVTVHVGYARV